LFYQEWHLFASYRFVSDLTYLIISFRIKITVITKPKQCQKLPFLLRSEKYLISHSHLLLANLFRTGFPEDSISIYLSAENRFMHCKQAMSEYELDKGVANRTLWHLGKTHLISMLQSRT
jgi:hypothetical protein